MQSSTLRSTIDPTIAGSSPHGHLSAMKDAIVATWTQTGRADMVTALRQHPSLLQDRSLLLSLAIEEYAAHRRTGQTVDLEQHCDRFREFGSSIRYSIQLQLEAQQYFDEHPDLLAELTSPKWPRVGERIGRFEVIEELGVGAIAHVYLCREKDIGDRRVVVKTTPFPSFEASILGRLEHPNIIPIHSAGFVEERDLHYVCMPYCGRSTLSDLLDVAFQKGYPSKACSIRQAAGRWIPADEWRAEWKSEVDDQRFVAWLRGTTYVDGILKLSLQIACALQHAHSQGILHGDLKPSNVLLTPAGRPLLLDFNLSREYSSSSGICGGTLPYMPPEYLKQVAGHTDDHSLPKANVTSDIYSFGTLLYQLLTGVTPANYAGHLESPAAIAKVIISRLEEGVERIRGRNPMVPPRIEALVERCLASNPYDRPRTLEEVTTALQRETSTLSAINRQVRTRPVFITAVVSLPIAILIGTAGYVAFQPERYLSEFRNGLERTSAGDFKTAINYFASSVEQNPSFSPARFELGRARIGQSELDLAMNEFVELALTNKHVASMAYVAYCFNLKRTPGAAIPWYEKAISSGTESAAVYNNLGASYLDGSTHLTLHQKLRRAEDCFESALKLDPVSTVVRLNLVRLAAQKAAVDPTYNPFVVWRHANALLDHRDAFTEFHVAIWYRTVRMRGSDPSQYEFATSEKNEQFLARARFEELLKAIQADHANIPSPFFKSPTGLRHRCYIEPVTTF